MLFNMVLPGAVEVVPPDENTLLLLHGEDLTDGSIYGHTVTNSGVSVSSAQSKFGGSSLYFNGSSRLFISPVDLFEFGTGDWTFDAWVYPLSQSNDNFFFSGAANGALFMGRSTGNSTLGIGRANVAWDNTIASTLALNTWNHVAYVKSSNKIYYFVNGKLIGSANNTISYGILGGVLNIGSQGANYYYSGYMDEVRMSNVARWTANFTPPTEPYNPGKSPAVGNNVAYTGHYTDNRVSGKGKVRLNTSGVLTYSGEPTTVSVYLLGGGGGGAYTKTYIGGGSGGGGGYQTLEYTLEPGEYSVVIGQGGATNIFYGEPYVYTAPSGGDTVAFEQTVTGGGGGSFDYDTFKAGVGGTPNGSRGNIGKFSGTRDVPGGSPNGGGFTTGTSTSDREPTNVTNGGDGYVELTFI